MNFGKTENILRSLLVEGPVATALVSKLPSGVINLICEFVGLEQKRKQQKN